MGSGGGRSWGEGAEGAEGAEGEDGADGADGADGRAASAEKLIATAEINAPMLKRMIKVANNFNSFNSFIAFMIKTPRLQEATTECCLLSRFDRFRCESSLSLLRFAWPKPL